MSTPYGSRRLRVTFLSLALATMPVGAIAQDGIAARMAVDGRLQRGSAAQIVAGHRGAMRSLEGTTLVRYSGRYDLYETLVREYGYRLEGVECIVVDERQVPRSHGWASYLRSLRPEAVDRVDLLFSGAMLRIYTLDFIARTPPGLVWLRTPTYIGRPHIEPLCA